MAFDTKAGIQNSGQLGSSGKHDAPRFCTEFSESANCRGSRGIVNCRGAPLRRLRMHANAGGANGVLGALPLVLDVQLQRRAFPWVLLWYAFF